MECTSVGVSIAKSDRSRGAVGETSPIPGQMLSSACCWSAMCCTVSTIDSGGVSTSPAQHGILGDAAIAESGDEFLKP